MAAEEPKPSKPQAEASPQSLLSASAEGAKFLILLQLSSRLLTFVVNQVLLRFLSPELLGISVQLELLMISVLYFSRESLRTALQRHGAEPTKSGEKSVTDTRASGLLEEGSPAAQSQTVVNLSLLTVPMGIMFATVLAMFYSRSSASTETAQQPYFSESIALYVVATLVELTSEPCFALAQQKLLYKLRAGAESAAAFTRCVLTCGVTVYAARVAKVEGGLGPLPFALGQLGYAFVLLSIYWYRMLQLSNTEGFSMGLKGIESSSGVNYYLSLFHAPLSRLATSMWLQSALKHVLTHFDTVLLSALSSAHSQGTYALASNYGSLIARMLFQPIEEASRNLFAKLLSSSSSSDGKPATDNVTSGANILAIIMKLYSLLSLFFFSLGPPFAPLALKLIAGSRWSDSEAGGVLASYCYYIPLLAINGVTEAFVQSVATERELAKQSGWMFGFSFMFAGIGWLFLSALGWGAKGLVAANAANMVLRIAWSLVFIGGYFSKYEGKKGVEGWSISRVLPSGVLVAASVGVGAVARGVVASEGGLIKEIGIGGGLGVGLIAICVVTERPFFESCIAMFRTTRAV